MRQCMDRLEHILEFGGTKKEIVVLGISGAALVFSLFGLNPLPFDVAWIAIVLCGIPIILLYTREENRNGTENACAHRRRR